MSDAMRKERGFSLVETMVVLAVVGTLVVLALTTYERHALRARRVLAHEALFGVVHAQELHRSVFHRYADTVDALGSSVLPTAHYSIALDDDMAPGFRVRATPVGRQRRDACGTLAIDHRGRRTSSRTTYTDTDGCW